MRLILKKALIIGCGGIGTGIDANGFKYSHNHAKILSIQGHRLSFLDQDKKAQGSASKRWSGHQYTNEDYNEFDIIVVSANTSSHYSILKDLKKYRYTLICEKPFCSNYNQAYEMAQHFKNKLYINYSRLFNQNYIEIKRMIKEGLYGQPLLSLLSYSKGIMNCGSHLISLMHFLFGEIKNLCKIHSYREKSSKLENIDFFAAYNTNNMRTFFTSVENSELSLWELKIYFQKGCLEISEYGTKFTFHSAKKHPIISNQKIVEISNNWNQIDGSSSLEKLYDDTTGEHQEAHFSVLNALQVHKVIESLKKN